MFGRRRDADPGTAPSAPGAHDPSLVLDLGRAGTVDLAPVPPRLRQHIWDTAQARERWTSVVDALSPGPLQHRLRQLGGRIDAGLVEMHATAVRIGEVERVLAALDPDKTTRDFKAARRRAVTGSVPSEMDALESSFRSVQRLLNLIADAEAELTVVDARLRAAVAKAAEMAFTADAVALDGLGRDIDGVVAELDALAHAFDGLA